MEYFFNAQLLLDFLKVRQTIVYVIPLLERFK